MGCELELGMVCNNSTFTVRGKKGQRLLGAYYSTQLVVNFHYSFGSLVIINEIELSMQCLAIIHRKVCEIIQCIQFWSILYYDVYLVQATSISSDNHCILLYEYIAISFSYKFQISFSVFGQKALPQAGTLSKYFGQISSDLDYFGTFGGHILKANYPPERELVVIHVSATPVPTPTDSLYELSNTGTTTKQVEAGESHQPSGQQGQKLVHFSFCAEDQQPMCQHPPPDPKAERLMKKIVKSCATTYARDEIGETVQMEAMDHLPHASTASQLADKGFFLFFFTDALGVEGKGVGVIHLGDGTIFKLSIRQGTWRGDARVVGYPVHDDQLKQDFQKLVHSGHRDQPRRSSSSAGCSSCMIL
ncbi:hypothetical protein EV360DRAFT_73841 [Lentinula raphanica]|nr:hypothetical protein EV360DRAFT_73841 [Lentinula raphanica]